MKKLGSKTFMPNATLEFNILLALLSTGERLRFSSVSQESYWKEMSKERRVCRQMGSQVWYFIAIFTLITTGESRQISSETCHPSDLKGLTRFKAAIRLDDSGRLRNWIGHGCCKWEGISCSNTTGRVTQINLPGFFTSSDDAPVQTSMIGYLSHSITLLSSLEVIDLSGLTGLSGNIPPSISFRLPKLRKLSLFGNKLEGQLPESIGKLSNLEVMYLHENSFSGSLPESLGNLKSLRFLDLHSNKYTGPIPHSIANLTNLETLNFQNNFLSQHIPDNIGDLQALKELDLSNNSLSGRIPSSITKLKAISVIYLNNNQLEGEIPETFSSKQMPALRFLRLHDNLLTGRIPESLGYLTYLERVSLANNKLQGSIPTSLGNLRSLTELYINGNRLSGQIPSSLGQLSQLLILDFSNNMIQEPLPQEMASLINLQTLDLSFNRLNLSSIPNWLLKLPSLSQIRLASCRIQGELTEYLQSASSSLQVMDFSDNNLTGNIPALIGSLKELYLLNLAGNSLVGQIPSTITNLVNLGVIDLHANKLEGSVHQVFEIHTRFGGGSLTHIDLSDNRFSTGIEQIGTGMQQAIQGLNLSHNFLEGRVPSSIGTLGSMQALDLSYNNIESELPPSLGNATSLERLKLQKNHFTGKIPNEFLKLKKLEELDLSNNMLIGEIPPGKPLIDFPKSSYLWNMGLCGKPLSPCRA